MLRVQWHRPTKVPWADGREVSVGSRVVRRRHVEELKARQSYMQMVHLSRNLMFLLHEGDVFVRLHWVMFADGTDHGWRCQHPGRGVPMQEVISKGREHPGHLEGRDIEP